MLETLFQNFTTQGRRRLAVKDSPSAQLAARRLRAPTALMQLSQDDARLIVSYMEPQQLAAGTLFMEEGQTEDTDYMLLILEGEVTVENIIVSRTTPVTTGVAGPGSMIGELGLLDGSPRSASCTAATDVLCAVLTRKALTELIQDDPVLGSKLLLAIGMRISERLRENTEKLKRYATLTQTMQQELDRLMPT